MLEDGGVKLELIFLWSGLESKGVVVVFIIILMMFLKWIGSGEFFLRLKVIGLLFVEVFWFFW